MVAVLLLRGDGGNTYKLRFQNAGQLVKDDDVQVGGRRIGSVRKITLTDDNQAEITIAVQEPYAPLHEGTTALIRATSLSGIANRYIALTPGPNSNGELSDGATLGTDKTTSIVDLDQLFNTLDPKTRKSLQNVIQGSAAWYDHRGIEANAATKYFNPALSASRRLVNELVANQQTLNSLLRNAAKTTGALAQRRGDLANLVSNTNTTAAAIAAENTSFNQAPAAAPRHPAQGQHDVREPARDARRPRRAGGGVQAGDQGPRALPEPAAPARAGGAPDGRRPEHARAPQGRRQRPHRPARQAPALERAAKPSFAHSITALQKATPVLKFLRPYTPDLVGWLRDFGQGSANYDANGHFARIQPIFNAYSFTDNPAGGTLTPIPPSQRLDGLQTGQVRRCPGAASQPPPDGSAPFRDIDGSLDCDPSLVLPGP